MGPEDIALPGFERRVKLIQERNPLDGLVSWPNCWDLNRRPLVPHALLGAKKCQATAHAFFPLQNLRSADQNLQDSLMKLTRDSTTISHEAHHLAPRRRSCCQGDQSKVQNVPEKACMWLGARDTPLNLAHLLESLRNMGTWFP